MTTKRPSLALLACAALLASATPTQAATIDVFAFDSAPVVSFPTCFSACSIGTPTSLAAPTPAGYQAIGFDTAMVYNDAGGNPAAPVVIDASGLPAHSSLNLGFLLAVIDSWDGNTVAGGTAPPDFFNITVDGVSIFSESYDNFLSTDQSASTANQLSFGSNLGFNGGWPDSAYDFTGTNGFLNVPHSASSFTIQFFASGGGWQGGTDESFGLDRIRVSVNIDTVPEPGALALLGIGLAALAAARRRKQ